MNKILTLIGVKLARKNRKFLFTGPADECATCPPTLKSVCLENLEKGCIYEIIEIRNIIHPCAVHKDGAVVVEVQKAPIKIAIAAKLAYEGAIISFTISNCDNLSCGNHQYCSPVGLPKDGKYKILKVFGNLPYPCEKGKQLKLVEIK
ncbi:MAG: UPF0179 family protein [Candidatus Helarchaeota archaeon]